MKQLRVNKYIKIYEGSMQERYMHLKENLHKAAREALEAEKDLKGIKRKQLYIHTYLGKLISEKQNAISKKCGHQIKER
jgi:hypothetical protein